MLVLRILNDNTGDEKIGNYNVDCCVTTSPTNLRTISKGRVEGYDRQQEYTKLLRLAIESLEEV